MEIYVEVLISAAGSAISLALLVLGIGRIRVELKRAYQVLTILSVVMLILYLDYIVLMPEHTLYSIVPAIPDESLIRLSSHVTLLLAFLSAYGVVLLLARPEENVVLFRYALIATIVYLIIAVTALLGIKSYHTIDATFVGVLLLLATLLGATMALVDLSKSVQALALLAVALLASIIAGPDAESPLIAIVVAVGLAVTVVIGARGRVQQITILAQTITLMGMLSIIFWNAPLRSYISIVLPILYAVAAVSLVLLSRLSPEARSGYTREYIVLYAAAFLMIASLQAGGSLREAVYSISWALVSYTIIYYIRRVQGTRKAIALAAASSAAVTVIVVALQRIGGIASAVAASITFTSVLALLAGITALPDYVRALLKTIEARSRAWIPMLLLSLTLASFAINPLFVDHGIYEASAPGTLQVCGSSLELGEADYGYSGIYSTLTYDRASLGLDLGDPSVLRGIDSIVASVPENISWVAELIVAGRIPGLILSPGIPGKIEVVDLASGANTSIEASVGSIMTLDLESPIEVYFDIEPANDAGLLRVAFKIRDLFISNEVLASAGMPSPSHMVVKVEYEQPLIIRGPRGLRIAINEAVAAPSGITGEGTSVEETGYGLILREAVIGVASGAVEYDSRVARIPMDCGDWCLRLRSLVGEIRRQEPWLAKLASTIPGIVLGQAPSQAPSIMVKVPVYTYTKLATSKGELYNILIIDGTREHPTILAQRITLVDGIRACSIYVKPKPLKGPFGTSADPLIIVYASGVAELNNGDYYAVIAALKDILGEDGELADVLWYSQLPGRYLVAEYKVEVSEYKLYYLSLLAPFTLLSAIAPLIAESKRGPGTHQ